MRGVFRCRGPTATPWVRVSSVRIEMYISAADYCLRGLTPPYEMLPWSSDPNALVEVASEDQLVALVYGTASPQRPTASAGSQSAHI